MNKDEFDGLARTLSQIYKDTYYEKEVSWDDEAEELMESAKPKYSFDKMLREVMIELHRSGQDTFMALKNDALRDWWSVELAKIKKEEAKALAREKAKSLLSEEERKLLGMKF
jgi:hypothetical protein